MDAKSKSSKSPLEFRVNIVIKFAKRAEAPHLGEWLMLDVKSKFLYGTLDNMATSVRLLMLFGLLMFEIMKSFSLRQRLQCFWPGL